VQDLITVSSKPPKNLKQYPKQIKIEQTCKKVKFLSRSSKQQSKLIRLATKSKVKKFKLRKI